MILTMNKEMQLPCVQENNITLRDQELQNYRMDSDDQCF